MCGRYPLPPLFRPPSLPASHPHPYRTSPVPTPQSVHLLYFCPCRFRSFSVCLFCFCSPPLEVHASLPLSVKRHLQRLRESRRGIRRRERAEREREFSGGIRVITELSESGEGGEGGVYQIFVFLLSSIIHHEVSVEMTRRPGPLRLCLGRGL